jgi:hypothetical protein
MAAEHDFECDQGAYWTKLITWFDEGGTNPVDITDYTARMQVRHTIESTVVLVEITSDPGEGITLGGVDGTILLEMTAAQTASLPAPRGGARHYYDLELVPPVTGRVRRLLQGRFVVSPEVTR